MTPAWLIPALIVLGTVVAMELTATAVHRYIMHGWGWGWHNSHHEPRAGAWEQNDLYGVAFAGVSMMLFLAGERWPFFWYAAIGTVIYGLLYVLLHDGLVHRRLPIGLTARRGYLKRLVQAHRLHHSVRDREGSVSFGFLYAPPVRLLAERLRAKREDR